MKHIGPTTQCNIKTYFHVLAVCHCPQLTSSAKNVTDQSFDRRPSTECLTNCHSDVSTHQHLARNFNKFPPVALLRFCKCNIRIVKSGMLGSYRLGAVEVSRQSCTMAGLLYF